jgi:serine/threonine protein kinase
MTLFKEQTEFSLNDIIYIFKGVLKGIEDCHKVKVIHRDLKPQNIIINLSTLKPKIIDFGLSLLYNSTT